MAKPIDTVLIHLGPPPPPYLAACEKQIEKVSGRAPLLIGPERGASYRGVKLDRFRAVEQLSGFGLEGFWRYACERFFVLEQFMAETELDRCIHLETDNLLYVPPSEYGSWLETVYGDSIAVCPLTDLDDTAAFMYVGSLAALSRITEALVELVEMGPARLLAAYGEGMAHEMKMLHILRTRMELCQALPVTIADAQRLDSPFVFDPGSYGQYVDGTVFEPGVSYAADHQLIGREFLSGNYRLVWDAGREQPLIHGVAEGGEFFPLVNLHVHSKRLDEVRAGRNRRGPSSMGRWQRSSRQALSAARRIRGTTSRLARAALRR